jgi:V-type H+-transporting ATPase subunit E
MNDREASTILTSMVQFIRTHGDERVVTIRKQTDDEYTSQREFYISNEKETIEASIRDRLRKDEINLKIARSKRENAIRIENMKTVNELIQQLFKEARVNIVKKQKQDAKAYQELIKNLIIQVSIHSIMIKYLIRA